MREAGCSIEDARDWLEENKRRVCHWISVDDLGHLYRGGRLSAAGAVVGTALGIKPIIDLNSEGKLITQEKVRGKNNVYAALARHLEDADNLDVIYITHAGAPEEAKKLAETIKKNYKVGEIRYSSIVRSRLSYRPRHHWPLSSSVPVRTQSNIPFPGKYTRKPPFQAVFSFSRGGRTGSTAGFMV